MSQLFDSLRRGRPSTAPAAWRGGARASHGEAVLASLGYTPVRRTRPGAVLAVVLVGIAAAALYAWTAWPTPQPAPQRTSNPSVRTAPPAPRQSEPAKPPPQTPSGPVQPPPLASPTRTVPAPETRPVATMNTTPTSGRKPAPVVVKEDPMLPVPRMRGSGATSSGPVPRVAPPAPAVDTRSARAAPPGRARTPEAAARPVSETEEFNLAVYYQRAGDFENALLKYRAVLGKNELNAQARNNLGLLYLDKGLLDDAVRELKRAVIIDPRYARARTNLGVAMMRQNRVDDAAAEFRAALAQDPRNVDALINLALAEKDAAPERAKELLIRALAIAPRSAWAHYNLAVVFDQSGEVARAVEHYRSFLENAGPDVSARAPDVRARLDALTRR